MENPREAVPCKVRGHTYSSIRLPQGGTPGLPRGQEPQWRIDFKFTSSFRKLVLATAGGVWCGRC